MATVNDADADAGDRSTAPGEGTDAASGVAVDPEAARRHIRERAETVREREQSRALRRLRDRRPLSEREEAAIECLAAGLTEELLSVPEAALRAAEREGTSDEVARVALALFGEP